MWKSEKTKSEKSNNPKIQTSEQLENQKQSENMET